jgi:hypothetical protein
MWREVVMKCTTTPLAGVIFFFAATPIFAQTWSGFLVDSKCYESMERNTDPWDTSTYVDRDKDWEIRFCSPSEKTKSFILVDHDGIDFRLDPAGNAKAAELLQKANKKISLEVVVTGEMSKEMIRVNSITKTK